MQSTLTPGDVFTIGSVDMLFVDSICLADLVSRARPVATELVALRSSLGTGPAPASQDPDATADEELAFLYTLCDRRFALNQLPASSAPLPGSPSSQLAKVPRGP